MVRGDGYAPLKQSDLPDRLGERSVKFTRRPIVIALVLVLSPLFFTLGLIFPDIQRPPGLRKPPSSAEEPLALETLSEPLKQCAASIPLPATPPAPVNLWASLTVAETVQISEWLSEPTQNLNLTSGDRAALPDNFIFHIEAYRPSKVAALQYLSYPHENTLPTRYARVTIHHGARRDADGGPVIKDYLVGPLPIGKETAMRELTEIYHRDDIPFNARMFTIPTEMTPLLMKIMPPLAEATQVRHPTLLSHKLPQGVR